MDPLSTMGRFQVVLAMVALLVVLNSASASASAQCIDYGDWDYLHWVGGVDTPGTAWCVAVAGNYAFVAH
ncbi:MAG: hypothetical protein JSW58_12415 [Candidatus Latescibacterota bacterium]|nr:MAG: hypothetical protein JSW58_12415 [Candidatus Latescibacterota bacterium]